MKDLIEALTIFMKYCGNESYPTKCDHDMLFVNCVAPNEVSDEDKNKLKELGFIPYEDFAFVSYRFGDN